MEQLDTYLVLSRKCSNRGIAHRAFGYIGYKSTASFCSSSSHFFLG